MATAFELLLSTRRDVGLFRPAASLQSSLAWAVIKKLCVTAWLASFPAMLSAQCECDWQGPFSWLVDDADYVVLGEVVSSKGNSFDLRVMRSLKGGAKTDTIRIWGERGDLCRPAVSLFPPGGQWLFALQEVTLIPPGGFNPATPSISYGRPGDYALSKCGAYWLAHENGLLSGNITSVFQWDYSPPMNPVPVDLIQAFIDGEADYGDIIELSDEVTSHEVWIRKMRQRLREGS